MPNSYLLTDKAQRATMEWIEAIGDALDLRDDLTADRAFANLIAGRAAFLNSASYNNGTAGNVCAFSNEHGSAAAGMAAYVATFGQPRVADPLAWLIPLNEAAVASLMDAYRRRGTFREASELRARVPVALRTLEAA